MLSDLRARFLSGWPVLNTQYSWSPEPGHTGLEAQRAKDVVRTQCPRIAWPSKP